MVMGELCEDDYESTESYAIYATIASLVLVLQICLFCMGIYEEYHHHHDPKFQKVAIARILYLMMISIGLFWIIIYFLGAIIDPVTEILHDTLFCTVFPYSLYIIPCCFYGLFLMQIQFRLENSFTGSFLALSKVSIIILRTIIFLIIITGIVSVAIDDWTLDCLQTWNPPEMGPLTYCAVDSASMIVFKYYIFSGITVSILIMEIVYAVLFTVKLKKFVKLQTQSGAKTSNERSKQFKIQALIIKNSMFQTVLMIHYISFCWKCIMTQICSL